MPTYAYHFSGYGRNNRGTFSITGLGTMAFNARGILSGSQRATSLGIPATGNDAQMSHSEYQLSGTVTFEESNFARADVDFRKVVDGRPETTPSQKGYYQLVYEGPKSKPTRFWFLSAHNANLEKTKPESVRGEAHFISDADTIQISAKRQRKGGLKR